METAPTHSMARPQGSPRHSKIAIFGGGPAGLFAGYFCKKCEFPFTLFEASERVGGNCTTLQFGDFRFDTGAHRFHDKDPEMTSEILQLLGKTMVEVSAPSYIVHDGRLIHFPITPLEILTKLSPRIVAKSAWEVVLARGANHPKNFRDYVYKKYGKSIADLFITNYSAKLWGVESENLSPQVAGSRLKNINLKALITELLNSKAKAKHMEGAFYYPKRGFGEIAETVADFCGRENIQTGSPITRIYHDGSRITAFEVKDRGTFQAREIASSLPLSVFVRLMSPAPPEMVMRSAQSIRFRHLRLVCLFLNKPSINKAATLYFPDRHYIFTRAYEPRNRSRLMSPEGKTSLIVEIPYSSGDDVESLPDKALVNQVCSQLIQCGLFVESEIADSCVKNLSYAYPVLEKGFEQHVEILNRYFARFENLYHTGRNGRFVYSWTHNMMQFGKEFVTHLRQRDFAAP